MRRGIIIRFIIVAVVMAGIFAGLSFSAGNTTTSNKPAEESCKKNSNVSEDDILILETFSRQLISINN